MKREYRRSLLGSVPFILLAYCWRLLADGNYRTKNWRPARKESGEQSNLNCSGRRCLGVGALPHLALLHTQHTHRQLGRMCQTHTMRTRQKRTRASSEHMQGMLGYGAELKCITGLPLLKVK